MNRKIGIKIKGRYGKKVETGPGPADYKIKDIRDVRGAAFKSKPKDKACTVEFVIGNNKIMHSFLRFTSFFQWLKEVQDSSTHL